MLPNRMAKASKPPKIAMASANLGRTAFTSKAELVLGFSMAEVCNVPAKVRNGSK